MKILIVHHLQPMWDSGLQRQGSSFEEMKYSLIEHLEDNYYDKVIFTMFEDYQRMDYHEGLYGNMDFIEYGYGWEPEQFEDAEYLDERYYSENDSILIPVSNAYYCERWALINDEVREWLPSKTDNVFICGAFEGECLADLESVLDHCNIEYSRINELIR
jgi:hypothetical protein